MMAFLGFLIGFLGAAPLAWHTLQAEFDHGSVTKGVGVMLGAVMTGGVVCGIFGAGLGLVLGALWEQGHRLLRRWQAPSQPEAASVPPAEPARLSLERTSSPTPGATTKARARALAGQERIRPEAVRYQRSGISVEDFVGLAQRVWPREYDATRVQHALDRTINIGAWDGDALIGSVRVLTDGYLFATVSEILVDPSYQRLGIGRELMRQALAVSPRGTLAFSAQPSSTGFFERIGAERGMTGFVLRTAPSERAVIG
jgi:GNAT superfamily N-acetyltransferase